MYEIEQLFTQIQSSVLRQYPLLSCCMKDGILFPEAYYAKSSLKIAFILKEPYAEWDESSNSPADCDFDFFDIIRDLKYHYENGLNKTWLKVAAIAYSLKNKTPYTETLSYAQVVEGLSCVAWINLSKTPWKTTTKMDAAYYERVRIWEPIVKEQLLEAAPNIVFYGNTWDASVINPLEPNINWQESFCTNTKEYIYKSDGGKQFRIYISQYQNTNKLLINGFIQNLVMQRSGRLTLSKITLILSNKTNYLLQSVSVSTLYVPFKLFSFKNT